ncbi:adenosylmethionine decarboxylase [Shewanella sp. SR44-3]|uniref:adenosylmethionine decarboxylase n=1 Tax=Shewanella sp. SR44-3 TaxID=2760936 RepID=UPI0015FD72F9|nr:adenosylmethionine decarboxylase [Shewanella sp. SR44-3]MBB1270321.1 adenosylmethionine decarboxylase [Shewanella sp. SR44-3]
MSLFFEGAEKKLEVVISDSGPNLRDLGVDFWHALVASADADILSQISNDHLDSYILSESSLFVWDKKLIMLTCGGTRLVNALMHLIQVLGVDAISFVSFQRKNEFIAALQPSTFAEDIALIRQHISGKAYRIGHLDSHHHYLFHSPNPYANALEEKNCELLMYHISGDIAAYLRSQGQNAEVIRQQLRLAELFSGFTLDDHLFSPLGYSVNGIKDDKYFTIHISPQEQSAYVSIETNLDLANYPYPVFAKLLERLQPSSWDIIGFNLAHEESDFPVHLCLGSCSITTSLGYNIHFSHYQQRCQEVLIPEFM